MTNGFRYYHVATTSKDTGSTYHGTVTCIYEKCYTTVGLISIEITRQQAADVLRRARKDAHTTTRIQRRAYNG